MFVIWTVVAATVTTSQVIDRGRHPLYTVNTKLQVTETTGNDLI
jgi:hypothetical protein